MNTFGDFLYELRKEKGITQAALAEMLGVTNKAVSKWETGEAMPETSLLLPIAEIFGVTVDELLNGKRSDEAKQAQSTNTNDYDSIMNNLLTKGKGDPETVLDKIRGAVCASVIMVGITVYLLLGALAGLWTPYWIILPTCALSCGIIGIVFKLCDAEKRKKMRRKNKNPYTEGICGIIILSCIIAYLFLGALTNLWHPYWFILIIGIAVDAIIGAVSGCIIYKNKNRNLDKD